MGSADPNRYKTNWQMLAFGIILLVAYVWMMLGEGYMGAKQQENPASRVHQGRK